MLEQDERRECQVSISLHTKWSVCVHSGTVSSRLLGLTTVRQHNIHTYMLFSEANTVSRIWKYPVWADSPTLQPYVKLTRLYQSNYNLALAIYFIAYVTFEVPSNVSPLVSNVATTLNKRLQIMFVPHRAWKWRGYLTVTSLKRFNPTYWLPLLTLTWGIVSICQGVVRNQAGLYAIRFCKSSKHLAVSHDSSRLIVLGATEAGL